MARLPVRLIPSFSLGIACVLYHRLPESSINSDLFYWNLTDAGQSAGSLAEYAPEGGDANGEATPSDLAARRRSPGFPASPL